MARATKKGTAWSKRELITLRAAARRGEFVSEVAARLGRTPAATQQKAIRVGISFR